MKVGEVIEIVGWGEWQIEWGEWQIQDREGYRMTLSLFKTRAMALDEPAWKRSLERIRKGEERDNQRRKG